MNNSVVLNENDVLPVGKKPWMLPESSCNKGLDEERILLLTSCNKGQFSCDNAQCIDISNRCDGVADCDDLSDEKSCRLVNVDPEKYLKDKTPPSEMKTLQVEVSGQVWAILKIQEVQQLVKLQFQLSLKWYDARLQYYNLKVDENMNSLVYKEKQKLWVPSIVFQNTEAQVTSQNDII